MIITQNTKKRDQAARDLKYYSQTRERIDQQDMIHRDTFISLFQR
jgi:hypothetical protein